MTKKDYIAFAHYMRRALEAGVCTECMVHVIKYMNVVFAADNVNFNSHKFHEAVFENQPQTLGDA